MSVSQTGENGGVKTQARLASELVSGLEAEAILTRLRFLMFRFLMFRFLGSWL